MISFRLDEEVGTKFPEAQVRFVVARGLQNDKPWQASEEALRKLESSFAEGNWFPFTKEHSAIRSWHDAYRRFGTNPNRIRPSVDALGRRMARSGVLPRISSAVDAYNFVSVKCGVTAGAFDLDAVTSPVTIRFAKLGDRFTPLGEPDAIEQPNSGEVVYASGNLVLTRHWNHRDADQTKVTAASTNVVFIIERISREALPDDKLSAAQQTLANFVRPYAQEITLAVISPEKPNSNLLPEELGR